MDVTIVSSTMHLMFQVFFFSQLLVIFLQKSFQFIFFHNFTKVEIKSFEGPKSKPLFYFPSIKMMLGPSDAWSIRRLTQQPSVYIEDSRIFVTESLRLLTFIKTIQKTSIHNS